MPSCNLAKSVHNKWLQASNNKGGDLYVAKVDDLVRVFLQCVGQHGFNRGGKGGGGPSPVELKLRLAHRTARQSNHPLGLAKVVIDYVGAEKLCTRNAHLELFSSSKRKAYVPLGANNQTHRLAFELEEGLPKLVLKI